METLEQNPLKDTVAGLLAYEPESMSETVRDWFEAADIPADYMTILPRLGVVAVDGEGAPCAAVWLRMDNSVSVAMPEGLIARPGNSLKLTRAASREMHQFLEQEALALGYTIFMAWTRWRGMGHELLNQGYREIPGDYKLYVKALE